MDEQVNNPTEQDSSVAPIDSIESGAGESVMVEGQLESGEEFSLELDYFDDQLQEDKLWQARTGLNPDTLCGAIETIIFMSDRPVPLEKIKSFIDPDITSAFWLVG